MLVLGHMSRKTPEVKIGLYSLLPERWNSIKVIEGHWVQHVHAMLCKVFFSWPIVQSRRQPCIIHFSTFYNKHILYILSYVNPCQLYHCCSRGLDLLCCTTDKWHCSCRSAIEILVKTTNGAWPSLTLCWVSFFFKDGLNVWIGLKDFYFSANLNIPQFSSCFPAASSFSMKFPGEVWPAKPSLDATRQCWCVLLGSSLHLMIPEARWIWSLPTCAAARLYIHMHYTI